MQTSILHTPFSQNKALSLLCFSLFSVFSGFSQKPQSSPIHFDHLTIQEKLSHNTVNCLVQDHYGYIWVGTQHGLNKYDGYSFEIFRSNEGSEGKRNFYGETISSLFEDSKYNLWVGTYKHGINIRKAGSDQFINLQSDSAFKEIQGYDISSISESSDGTIWITTVDGGVLAYEPESGNSKLYTAENSNLSDNRVFDVEEDGEGKIWVATSGAGLNLLKEDGRFDLVRPQNSAQPEIGGYRKKMLRDGDFLWVATEGSGLHRIQTKEQTFQHFAEGEGPRALNSSVVRDIHKAKDGRLYIATDGGGLNIYDPKTDQVSVYLYKSGDITSLNTNALLCFLEDRSGNIWIGSFNGGLNINKVHKTRFEFIPQIKGEEQDFGHRSILSIHQSQDGKIWLGTDGGGLNWLNPESKPFSQFAMRHDPTNPNSLGGNVVKTIFEDADGYIWIGMFSSGLNRYDPKSGQFQRYQNDPNTPQSLSSGNVWSISQSQDGRLWIGTIGGGLNVLNPETEIFSNFQPEAGNPGSLGDIIIMSVLVDQQDKVWIGTANNGLDLWEEGSRTFRHFRHDPLDSTSISNNEIRAIFQDSKGNLWIGTEGGGLNHWLGEGKFERIGKRDGLIANSVVGITEDKEGMIWVSTFEGLSRIDPQSKEVRNFDFHVGQNSNQFNQMATLTAADGKLYFGGINGLNAIHPEQIKKPEEQTAIVFTGLKVLNKHIPAGELADGRIILTQPIEEAELISLEYFDNSFSLSFTAIDFTDPLKNVFTYKMDGFDDIWQQTSAGQHSITYTNLDPGTYSFMVRHLRKEKAIKVRISPPFWQTYWFRALASLCFIGLLVFAINFIINRREAAYRQQMLEAESEILQLRNEKLATDLDAKNSKLMFSAVQMAHKNEILTHVKEEVKSLEEGSHSKSRQLLRMLDQELKSEDYWEEFNLYFSQVDKNFGQTLLQKHPDLTSNDLRICALIRINLTTKEIASLLNISSRGVEQSRYRLKKRLGLDKEENLAKYISGFSNES